MRHPDVWIIYSLVTDHQTTCLFWSKEDAENYGDMHFRDFNHGEYEIVQYKEVREIE